MMNMFFEAEGLSMAPRPYDYYSFLQLLLELVLGVRFVVGVSEDMQKLTLNAVET